MGENNNSSFMWIIILFFFFFMFGFGGNGNWGGGRERCGAEQYAGVQAVNDTIGTKAILDTVFASIQNDNNNYNKVATQMYGVSQQIDGLEMSAITRENANLRQQLARYETKEDMQSLLNPVYAQLASLGCEVSKLPKTMPLYNAGVTACGQFVPNPFAFNGGCGCGNL